MKSGVLYVSVAFSRVTVVLMRVEMVPSGVSLVVIGYGGV